MSENELIDLYKKLDYVLHISDGWLWQDLFRTIGGGLVFLLSWLNSFIEEIIDKVITLNNFYSSGPIKDFMDIARPIVWGVFFIALFILGFQLMMNKIEKRNEIILNVILALCFIVVIPDLMVNMGKITKLGVEEINPEKQTLSTELVKSNVADVRYYAERNFHFSSKKSGDAHLPPRPASKSNSKVGTTDFTYANRLSTNALPYISFAEKLDIKTSDEKGGMKDWAENNLNKHIWDGKNAVLNNKLVATGNGDQFKVQQLRENQIPLTTLGQESYYRYHVNWLVLIFSLAVTTLALAITVIKIGRSVFDLAFHQIFGMFIAATDLTGGQRTKKVLVEIMNTFAIIFIMTMLLKLFILYSSWANGLKGSIGGVGVLLMLIAGAWALIDAPDIVARMMGIDAGLRSGYQALMGAYAGTKLAGTGLKTVGKGIEKGIELAGKAATGLASGANFARRTASGVMLKTPEEISGRTKSPVKPMPGMAERGDIANKGQESLISNIDHFSKMDNDGMPESTLAELPLMNQDKEDYSVPSSDLRNDINDVKGINGRKQSDPIPTTMSRGGGHVEKDPIPNSIKGNAAGVTEIAPNAVVSKGNGVAEKRIQKQSNGSIPLQNNHYGQSLKGSSNSQWRTSKIEGNIPSGYVSTASGLLVPKSAVQRNVSTGLQGIKNVNNHKHEVNDIPSNGKLIPDGSTIQGRTPPEKMNANQSVPNPVVSNASVADSLPALSQNQSNSKGPVNRPFVSGQTVSTSLQQTTSIFSSSSGKEATYGHKNVQHTNTLFGANPHVRQAKEQIVRAGNSGFNLGQNIRRLGRGAGKAAVQTTRAVVHPKQTLHVGMDKAKIATQTGVKNIKQTKKSIVKQIKTPPGQKINWKGHHNE